MSKARPSLRDEITAALPSRARKKWEESLEPDVRAELEELRADWAGGRLGNSVTKSGLARAIAKTLSGRGTQTSPHTVFRWLDR